MDEFEIFNPKCVCLILDVAGVRPAKDGFAGIEHVKTGIIKAFSQLQEDDLVYVYQEDGELAMGKTLGQSLSIVSDWQHKKMMVANAVDECIHLLRQHQSQEDHRGIFYFTDNYRSLNDGLLVECFNRRHLHGKETNMYVYAIGRSYAASLRTLMGSNNPFYHFRHLDDYSQVAKHFAEDLSKL